MTCFKATARFTLSSKCIPAAAEPIHAAIDHSRNHFHHHQLQLASPLCPFQSMLNCGVHVSVAKSHAVATDERELHDYGAR